MRLPGILSVPFSALNEKLWLIDKQSETVSEISFGFRFIDWFSQDDQQVQELFPSTECMKRNYAT